MKILPPIIDSQEDWDDIEETIKRLFRKHIYAPLLRHFQEKPSVLRNALPDSLLTAIKTGRIQFNQGRFSGKLSAAISKDLRALGAKYDRSTGTYRIQKSELPYDVRMAISASESVFQKKMEDIDELLRKMVPEEIADKLSIQKNFDSSLWKFQKDLKKTLRNITVPPALSPEQASRISKEWENNMKLWIRNWTEEEIKKLRQEMKKVVFSGNRYESAVQTIKKSYGVSENKAKFLARQETNLLLSKFKETRYKEAGVDEYKWRCVVGSPNHPVRPMHKALDGKIFRWDSPPITSPDGRRNNPGQDFNCRCHALPIVRFK